MRLAQELGFDANSLRRCAGLGSTAAPCVEPTGIVDLLITTAPAGTGAIARNRVDVTEVRGTVVALRSRDHRKTKPALAAFTTLYEPQAPRRQAFGKGSGNPSSRIGTSPLFNSSARSASMSAHTVSCRMGRAHRRRQPHPNTIIATSLIVHSWPCG